MYISMKMFIVIWCIHQIV
uniref:Uncharacterized protein n=1 Tax=Arundo donax TaxID=35708 RepID=A0A0A9BKR2_ARUDO